MQQYGKAGSIAEEVLSAIRTVLAFGGETKEIKRYIMSKFTSDFLPYLTPGTTKYLFPDSVDLN